MQTRVLRIATGIVLVLAGYLFGSRTATTPIHAQSMRANVPTSYGHVISGDSSSLWFEDSSGTLRQVTIPAGHVIYTIDRK